MQMFGAFDGVISKGGAYEQANTKIRNFSLKCKSIICIILVNPYNLLIYISKKNEIK